MVLVVVLVAVQLVVLMAHLQLLEVLFDVQLAYSH
jgi:hypothetical protein